MSHILWSHGLQHARLLCPSISPEFCSDSCWIESVVLSNHLIFHCTLLPLPSIFPSIRGSLSMRGFSSELTLCIRWLKCWSFSISPSNEYSEWLPLGLTSLISLLPKGLSRVFSNTQIFCTRPSLHLWFFPWKTTAFTLWTCWPRDVSVFLIHCLVLS